MVGWLDGCPGDNDGSEGLGGMVIVEIVGYLVVEIARCNCTTRLTGRSCRKDRRSDFRQRALSAAHADWLRIK